MNNSRRHIARLAAAAVAVSFLGVGLAASPAHASVCETQTERLVWAADVQKLEDNTTMKFTLNTDGCLTKASVTVSNYFGEAEQFVDYIPAFKTLSWQEGDATSRTVYVTIKEDSAMEAHEKFGLVRHSTSGVVSANKIIAVGTIIDDDYPVIY